MSKKSTLEKKRLEKLFLPDVMANIFEFLEEHDENTHLLFLMLVRLPNYRTSLCSGPNALYPKFSRNDLYIDVHLYIKAIDTLKKIICAPPPKILTGCYAPPKTDKYIYNLLTALYDTRRDPTINRPEEIPKAFSISCEEKGILAVNEAHHHPMNLQFLCAAFCMTLLILPITGLSYILITGLSYILCSSQLQGVADVMKTVMMTTSYAFLILLIPIIILDKITSSIIKYRLEKIY